MKILICSDGMPAAESAIQLGGLLAGPLQAETTILGIAESSADERPLREALEKQAQPLRVQKFGLEISMHARSEEHTSELQSLTNLVCRLLLEKKKEKKK